VKRLLTLPVLLCLMLPAAAAQHNEDTMVWLVKDIAQAPAEKLELRDKHDRVVQSIATRQLIYLYAVESAIEEVAEIHADFYLLEGKDPNAMATLGPNGENIIAVNFAMLDLIGMDMDAAAAILGHELAHLKLNHREESKEAMQRNVGQMITAANTRYSRDNEREADYLGMIWAVEAGYDPNAAARIHEELYKLSKRRGGGFAGSHPSSLERITVLKSLARRLSKN